MDYNFESQEALQLTSINLKNKTLHFKQAKGLAEMINKNNCKLKKLNLEGTKISPRGLKLIFYALKVNCTLESLSLKGLNITPKNVQALFNILRDSPANSSLKSLDMSLNQLQTKGMEIICEIIKVKFPSLRSIYLKSTNAKLREIDPILQYVKASPSSSLGSLDLSQNPNLFYNLAENSAARLFDTNIKILNLAHTNLTSRTMRMLYPHIQLCKYLKVLDLQGNHLSSDSFLHLGLALMMNTSLECLNLKENRLLNGSLFSIALALEMNKQIGLKRLYIDNQMPHEDELALIKSLRTNTSVTHIERSFSFSEFKDILSCNPVFSRVILAIDLGDLELFCAILKKNKALKGIEVKFNGTRASTHELFSNVLTILSSHPSIRCLTITSQIVRVLGYCNMISLENFLKLNTSIVSLDLTENNISFEEAARLLEALQHNRNIKELNLRRNHVAHSYNVLCTTRFVNLISKSGLYKLSVPYQWIGCRDGDEGREMISGLLGNYYSGIAKDFSNRYDDYLFPCINGRKFITSKTKPTVPCDNMLLLGYTIDEALKYIECFQSTDRAAHIKSITILGTEKY
jgi:Ran GTPase-activating protein (RanGAP) involved in mRNA processing and transport